MKTVVVFLLYAVQCLWARTLTDESRALLQFERKEVMDILKKYKSKGFSQHDFFSYTNQIKSENGNSVFNYHETHDTHQESLHLEFLNRMAHGLVDILEQRNGRLAVYLNRLNFSGIAAKKYRQDSDHSKRFTALCKTMVNVDLKYTVRRHNMTHIKDCIAQGVLRLANQPNAYLEYLFEAIEQNGMCALKSRVPECEVKNTYSITSDLCNYTPLFEEPPEHGLVPLQNITAEKSMTIECVDERLSPVRITYETFQTCKAEELNDDY